MDSKIILEATDYEGKASEIISSSGLFNPVISKNIISGLKTDIHAFAGSGHNWLLKYLKGIARMMVEYANGNSNKAVEFLIGCPSVFDIYLTWVKSEREHIKGDNDKVKFDNIFIDEMSYDDVVNEVSERQKKMQKKSREELANMQFGDSKYKLVPINSYEEFHRLYGGDKTGNETGDGSEWCHANSKTVYDGWTGNGEKMFVLEEDGWEDIHFNEETNAETNGEDDYGKSLIAIRVGNNGMLLNATLRCNHEKNIKLPDNKYFTFSELSKIVDFNVEDKVREYVDFEDDEEDEIEEVADNDVEEIEEVDEIEEVEYVEPPVDKLELSENYLDWNDDIKIDL